ncbi:MAG: imidazole glycerol phosphate synthase subunit HisH [Proteobacteria bacterium]|nr:imidazole glycerol phosphate synthase subunit HisH [Pseudomonadota bacterium]
MPLKPSVSVIDYGIGNISSVVNALLRIGCSPKVAVDGEILRRDATNHIILPGVGAIGQAMHNIEERGIREALQERVIGDEVPYLGICVGMQILVESGEEFGDHKCLGWIPGRTCNLASIGESLRVPHVGWNTIEPKREDPLFNELPDTHFYFVHSYCVECPEQFVTAETEYGGSFIACIRKGNIAGVQFHPEKSAAAGDTLLKNFLGI